MKTIGQNEIKWALLGAFVAWFFAALVFQSLVVPLFFGVIGFAVAFGVAKQWPHWQKRMEIEKAEAELPFVLLRMSIELALHRSFEKALESASQSEFVHAGKEFETVVREIRWNGASIPEALRHLLQRLQGKEAKRAIAQVVLAYEQGTRQKKSRQVKRMASELLARQRIEAKAFGGKVALFSLLFIVVSAIIPAFFQSFVLIGSSFLEMDFSAAQVFWIIALGFPALDLAVLVLLRQQTPVFLR